MLEVKFDEKEIKRIQEQLEWLAENYAKNATRRALRKAAAPIRDQAKRNAEAIDDPETPAEIHKNITIRAGKMRKGDTDIKMRIGIMGGARLKSEDENQDLPGKNTTHWRLIEFGTSKTAARPFMRPAMHQGAQQALADMLRHMQLELDKEVKKRL